MDRRWFRGLALAALAACSKDAEKNGEPSKVAAPPATAADLDTRCDLLGKTCGDKDKHVEKIGEECRQVAKKQVEKGCAAAALALSDCYAKELCGREDKVWAFGDLPVLAERKGKCVPERAAVDACVAKSP